MSDERQTIRLEQLGAGRADQLARIAEAGLIDQGRVFLLSLEPIRAEMGPRWAVREELVWDTMLRTLTRQMPPPDIFLRIDDVTVLAAVASVDAYEGRVRCAEALSSTLTFFLGRSAREDLQLSRVSSLEGGLIRSDPIDPHAPPPAAAASRPAPSGSPKTPDGWTPPLGGRRFSAPFLSERLGSVAMALEVTPVWRLDHELVSAYAVRRRLSQRIECLTDADRYQVAHRTLDHILPILDQYRREGGAFALVAPCPFSVLASNRDRQALLGRIAEYLDIMRRTVLLEVDGFGSGAPMGLVSHTAAMLRPFFRALTANVRDAAECATAVGEFAFNGIAIEAGAMSDHRLALLIRSARRRTPNVMVHDPAASDDWLRDCGVSHVTRRLAAAAGDVRPDLSVPAPVQASPARRAGG
ncbi:hypothetical protein [Brevundimonas sp.]|uniref:hypothetical protein n=1 Tax=Brevundimonas sp. TaxID=1871086 RepID=UPI0035AE96AA